ncbi:MAG TPA: carboxypeptidase-like regulatory domain-containing protein [Bryobacteraceae bacterium]|nr:carboxypeptidase-like regulatory domain-containing protein [Bryobacteraceae bacterium]
MRLVSAALLVALAAAAVQAQNPVVLSGQVTDAMTGLPIEGATVAIADQLGFTDSAGHYTLDSAMPGSADVRVEAKGYLAFARTNPDDAKIPIAADQAIHNFRLMRAASIVGKISAPDPEWRRAGFFMSLLQEDFTDGVRRFTFPTLENGLPAASVSSTIDEDGSFRFNGLEPGRYIVYASGAGFPAGNFLFVGRDKDGKPLPPKHVDEGYVQTFFPGAADFAAAIPITVESGETKTADFTLVKQPLYRVSGEAEGDAAASDTIGVEAIGKGVRSRVYNGIVSGGKFVVEGLPPGDYRIRTMAIPEKKEPTGNGGFRVSMFIVPLNTPFSITDHDITDLHLPSLPLASGPVTTTGQFRLAGGGALPGGLSVQFADSYPGGESTAIAASADGVFWLMGGPGEYSVRPIVPALYAVTEIRYGGGNYLNSLLPLDGKTADSTITIVLTDQPASISGALTDDAGKPVAAKVVLLPDPIPAQFDFRAIRVALTNERGGFALGGLAPGRYKALALTGDDRRQDHDMTLIGPRLGPADAFELTAGQNLTITLRP